MSSSIDLSSTSFVLAKVVQSLPLTKSFLKDKLITMADFGTLFIGEPTDKDISLPQDGAPIFQCPPEWQIAHVLKALGAFPSTSQARKNGWDFEIIKGISIHVFRINKVRGELWVHKE